MPLASRAACVGFIAGNALGDSWFEFCDAERERCLLWRRGRLQPARAGFIPGGFKREVKAYRRICRGRFGHWKSWIPYADRGRRNSNRNEIARGSSGRVVG